MYPLPIGGNVKQWNETRCPVEGCSFELSLYTVGSPSLTYPLCPQCFNNPRKEWGAIPGEGGTLSAKKVDADDERKELEQKRIGGKSMTLECPLQDGHPLIQSLTVSPDPDSGGVLILDVTSGPKYKLISTRAPTTVHLPHCIERLRVLDESDEVLKCRKMEIRFKTGESPLEDGALKYVTCFPEDEILQKMVRVFHGSDRQKAAGRGGGRGRGRGRGGGGRGRGRGRR